MKKPQCRRFTFFLWPPSCEKTAKQKLVIFSFLTAALFYSGCSFVGTAGTLGSPTSHEKKIPAEYDLTMRRKQKILVLVNQPAYLDAQANLRFYLTEAMSKNLVKKVKIRPWFLVGYNELSEFRSNRPDFSLLSPAEVGTALDADMVLLVTLEEYQLHELAETGYYKGFLSARAILLDTATGEKLWPKSAKSKSIKVGFEVESYGQEVAVKRLMDACAHCTVRYFYNCPKDKFKTFDDKSDISWEEWRK